MSPDVVVVGAGIAGVSAALELVERGVAVTLLDRADVGGGSTGAGEGNVLLCDKTPGPELELTKLGQALYDELEQRYPDVARIRRIGSLVVYPDENAIAGRQPFADAMRAAGVACVEVDALQEVEPELAADLPGALHFPTDLQCDPLGITRAAAGALRGLGGKVTPGATVHRIQVEGGRVAGVETGDGTIACGAVVLAAGAWTAPLAATAGLHLPVAPRKGQLAMTEAAPGFVRHKIIDATYADAVASDAAGVQVATVLETTWTGEVLIGSSRELAGFDDTVDAAVTARLVDQAARLAPRLRTLRVTDTWAGLRPYLPDQLPAIGPSRLVEGLWATTGHEGAGIALGPVSGRLVAQSYCGEPLPLDLAPFDPDRFGLARP